MTVTGPFPAASSSGPSGSPPPSRVSPLVVTPPVPGRWGNALQLRDDPLGTLLRWQDLPGDVVKVQLRRWTFVLNRPDDVKHVLVAQQGRYHKGENLKVASAVFGQGLLTSEEPLHLEQRHLMQPAFHRDILRSYAECMVDRTGRLARSWASGGTVNVHEAMMRLTLDIAAKTMFGLDNVAEAESLSHAIDVAQEVFRNRTMALWSPPEWFPTPQNLRAWRALDVMDGLVLKIIQDRRARPGDQTDLLSLLLRARDDQGLGMDDGQLRDEALTLLLAGHETTAGGLSWALHLLAQNPSIQDQVRDEVASVLHGRLPTVQDVPQLDLVDRVFAESLRLYPSAWVFTRRAMEADTLESGVTIPAGDEVMVSPWSMQRNPAYFPKPETFDPDRFLPEARERRPQFSYFPFGGGSRRCIGEPFAKMEAILVLATLFGQGLKFSAAPGDAPVPEPMFTLRPRGGLRLQVRS